MPGSVLSASNNLYNNPVRGWCYWSHFTDTQTEAQKDQVTGSRANERQRWDLNLGLSVFLTNMTPTSQDTAEI